jgi:SpoVK/Ycf46/Vps4 family AAA+-type ATPase
VASESVLKSLGAAVEAAPDDISLRLHLSELLAEDGQRDEAVRHAAAVLARDPTNLSALKLITGAASAPAPEQGPDAAVTSSDETLRSLDEQLSDLAPPMFVEGDDDATDSFDVERSAVTLSDVGGMEELKARLEAAVLTPMRNPELGRLFAKSTRGGLLMYGPPGCGKTFIARALAGELGAKFMAVSLADVLDMYIGQSERNVHDIFETARRNAPCVIFLDELDALGRRRSQMGNNAARGSVNQLLHELDGALQDNAGVFVLGATNHPWDVDTALRRPGRFDRMMLVLPPDQPAREQILRYHLQDRPIANIDVAKVARLTEHFSGADLAYVCELAAEQALMDSVRAGTPRMIEMSDLEAAAGSVTSSITPWLQTARNVAQFANEGGTYDELAAYLRQRRML